MRGQGYISYAKINSTTTILNRGNANPNKKMVSFNDNDIGDNMKKKSNYFISYFKKLFILKLK